MGIDVQQADTNQDDDGLTLTAETFDVTRHDGTVTIFNPATGGHATIRIRTVPSGTMEGKRVVALLTGPDNGTDYEGFAFADESGVHVWTRMRATVGEKATAWEVYARLLADPKGWAERRGLEYLAAVRCRRCGRTLTHPGSIASGYGPICADRD